MHATDIKPLVNLGMVCVPPPRSKIFTTNKTIGQFCCVIKNGKDVSNKCVGGWSHLSICMLQHYLEWEKKKKEEKGCKKRNILHYVKNAQQERTKRIIAKSHRKRIKPKLCGRLCECLSRSRSRLTRNHIPSQCTILEDKTCIKTYTVTTMK